MIIDGTRALLKIETSFSKLHLSSNKLNSCFTFVFARELTHLLLFIYVCSIQLKLLVIPNRVFKY